MERKMQETILEKDNATDDKYKAFEEHNKALSKEIMSIRTEFKA